MMTWMSMVFRSGLIFPKSRSRAGCCSSHSWDSARLQLGNPRCTCKQTFYCSRQLAIYCAVGMLFQWAETFMWACLKRWYPQIHWIIVIYPIKHIKQDHMRVFPHFSNTPKCWRMFSASLPGTVRKKAGRWMQLQGFGDGGLFWDWSFDPRDREDGCLPSILCVLFFEFLGSNWRCLDPIPTPNIPTFCLSILPSSCSSIMQPPAWLG